MSNKRTDLPHHLAPLLEPTPSGVTKLVAAWDGLNTESQIFLLTALDNARLPAYLNEKIRKKALGSANAYVRYLAATEVYSSPHDSEERKAVRQRIEEDPDPLVRYCLLENEWRHLGNVLDDADAFFALPHEARLAKVRLLTSAGENMAALIAHAVDHQLKAGNVSEIQLFEILSDYVNKPSFKDLYSPTRGLSYDGDREYRLGKDIEALWELVPKLPEGISYILIEHLPTEEVGLNHGIPEKVFNELSSGQLETLLYRQDVGLENFRKKIFKRPAERLDRLRCAAITYNFDLSYAEFAAILSKPQQNKTNLLRDLASFAHGLSLVLYEAIHDALFAVEEHGPGLDSPWQDAEHARNALERRLKPLKDSWRDEQLRELRLYRLARQAAPWKKGGEGYPLSGEVEFLSKLVIDGDTWGTFMAFSKAWPKDSWHSKKLEQHLPGIDDAGENELGNETQADDENPEKPIGLMRRIERKLSDIVSTLTADPEDQQTEREDRLSKLTRDVTRLQVVQDRQSLLFYVVIALLIWLLIKLF
jgi:hypothetical protein